jgi:WXG100 family type VII secretion target
MANGDMDSLDLIVYQLQEHAQVCRQGSQSMKEIVEQMDIALVGLRDQAWEGAAKQAFQVWYPNWRKSFLTWCDEVFQWGVKTHMIASEYDEKDRQSASELNQLAEQQVTPEEPVTLDDVLNW